MSGTNNKMAGYYPRAGPKSKSSPATFPFSLPCLGVFSAEPPLVIKEPDILYRYSWHFLTDPCKICRLSENRFLRQETRSMPVHEIRHPLIRHKLGIMRQASSSTKTFRELAQEIAALLTYEATKDFPLETHTTTGWAGEIEVEKIAGKKVTIVPILRAGLGMLDGVLSLIPAAHVSVVGQVRDEDTLESRTYLNKLV